MTFVFIIRTEKRGATGGATVKAFFEEIGVFAFSGRVGSFFAQNVILPRRKDLTPFFFALPDFYDGLFFLCGHIFVVLAVWEKKCRQDSEKEGRRFHFFGENGLAIRSAGF